MNTFMCLFPLLCLPFHFCFVFSRGTNRRESGPVTHHHLPAGHAGETTGLICLHSYHLKMSLNVSPAWPAGRRCCVTRLPSRPFCLLEKSTGAREQACNSCYIGSLDKYLYCLFNLVTFFVLFFLGGRIDEKAAQLHAITSLQAMLGKQQGSFAGGVNGNNSLTPQGPEVRQTRWDPHHLEWLE